MGTAGWGCWNGTDGSGPGRSLCRWLCPGHCGLLGPLAGAVPVGRSGRHYTAVVRGSLSQFRSWDPPSQPRRSGREPTKRLCSWPGTNGLEAAEIGCQPATPETLQVRQREGGQVEGWTDGQTQGWLALARLTPVQVGSWRCSWRCASPRKHGACRALQRSPCLRRGLGLGKPPSLPRGPISVCEVICIAEGAATSSLPPRSMERKLFSTPQFFAEIYGPCGSRAAGLLSPRTLAGFPPGGGSFDATHAARPCTPPAPALAAPSPAGPSCGNAVEAKRALSSRQHRAKGWLQTPTELPVPSSQLPAPTHSCP